MQAPQPRSVSHHNSTSALIPFSSTLFFQQDKLPLTFHFHHASPLF